MEKHSIMQLNDIITKIYSIENFDEMRRAFLVALQIMIPNAFSTFYITSGSGSLLLKRPIGLGISAELMDYYIEEVQEIDNTRWTFSTTTAKAYRDTPYLESEMSDSTSICTRYYSQLNVRYQASATIIHNGVFLGVVALCRKPDSYDFTDDDLFKLELLIPHLEYRVFKEVQRETVKISSYISTDKLISNYHLTLKEIEIVYLILDGLNKDQICEKLSISPNTLKKHNSNIYRKMDINSYRELFQLLNY